MAVRGGANRKPRLKLSKLLRVGNALSRIVDGDASGSQNVLMDLAPMPDAANLAVVGYFKGNITFNAYTSGPRIELSNEEVRPKIAAGEWRSLLPADQLMISQRSGAAFGNFQEAPITFQPTYKYDAGTSVYDTSEKARVPSWTDRVLYRPAPAEDESPLTVIVAPSLNRS